MPTRQRSRTTGASAARNRSRRTALRVPASLDVELAKTAKNLGVSENEGLFYLAKLGAEAASRHRARQRVIARRRKAVVGPNGSAAGTFPSPLEAREAILVDRH